MDILMCVCVCVCGHVGNEQRRERILSSTSKFLSYMIGLVLSFSSL